MDKEPKKNLIPHTEQQSVERVAEMRAEKVTDIEKVIREERATYETLLRQKQELFDALESAKRNKDKGEQLKKRRELDDVEAAIKVYDKEFPVASVNQSMNEDEARTAAEERSRRLN